jgi:hypothetical protein
MVKKDWTAFWAHLAADGAPVCRVVISDITERMQAAEEIRKLNADLELRINEIELKNAELKQKNHELELMNKAFVSRELRMVELKERIRELERHSLPDGKTISEIKE